MDLNADNSNSISKLNYRDFMIFLFPVMIFAFYLFVYNPGILTFDSFSQLHQIVTGNYTNGQPFFHTFIEMICLKIYSSPLSIAILQIFVFSLMWMMICKYHRDDSVESSSQYVFQFTVTFIISFIPINAINSITLSSYILFSYFLMFLCFLIKVMIDKEGQIDLAFTILLALTMAFVFGLNSYGIYIVIITLIFISAYLFKKDKSNKMYIALPAIVLVCMLLVASLSVAYDVSDDHLNGQANQNNEINLEQTKTQYFASINETPTDSLENPTAVNFGNDKYNLIDSFVNLIKGNFILDTIFNNAILYFVLSIILLIFIYSLTKHEEIYLIYLPILLNMIIAFVSNSFQINNYLYSNLLVCYLIIIILLYLWHNQNSYPQDNLIPKHEPVENTYTNSNENVYTSFETEEYDENIETKTREITLDEINTLLNEFDEEYSLDNIETQEEINSNTLNEEPQLDNIETPNEESDLLNQILKEIEMEKENRK